MVNLNFKDKSKIDFSDSYLNEFVLKNNIQIPAELIEFLKIQNGGRLSDSFFEEHWVTDFFPLYDERYGTISQTYSYLLSEEIEGMIPFAGDPDSKTYCISVRQDDLGGVYCYLGGDWVEGENPLFKISESFADFINAIKHKP